jgi:hypothetical protein
MLYIKPGHIAQGLRWLEPVETELVQDQVSEQWRKLDGLKDSHKLIEVLHHVLLL